MQYRFHHSLQNHLLNLWTAIWRTLPVGGRAQAFSIVEILVAMAILSILSVAIVKLVTTTETQLITDYTDSSKKQQSEAISNYVYDDFQRGKLGESSTPQLYANSEMPQDLRKSGGLNVVTLIGNSSRYDGVLPACRLVKVADYANAAFEFNAGCFERNSKTIAQRINEMIALGIKVGIGLDGSLTRCTISKFILNPEAYKIARAFVDDPSCLLGNQPNRAPLPIGTEILTPRFIAYDAENPKRFNTTLVEPVGKTPSGIELEMPDTRSVIGGGVKNDINIVDAIANIPQTEVRLMLQTQNARASLNLNSVPSGVFPRGLGLNQIILEGPIEAIRLAMTHLNYRSARGFFGTDEITATMRSGVLSRSKKTKLDVRANCGNQTCGTATRFDLGSFDQAKGVFTTHQYLTTVTVCGTEMPSTYYGYCGRAFRFDSLDGLPNRDPSSAGQCASASNPALQGVTEYFPQYQPDLSSVPNFPYIEYSPKARNQRPDAITVYLYEMVNMNTPDRFSLFFNFDTFDASGGNVDFTLSNMEQGRNLDNRNDPYTFTDDPGEYTATIGQDGILLAGPRWLRPNDGVVLPLRLPPQGRNPQTGEYDLKYYAQDPDWDGNVNPRLLLRGWNGLDQWNIRSVSDDNRQIEYRQIPFNANTPEPKTAIQLVVNESQRCSKIPLSN